MAEFAWVKFKDGRKGTVFARNGQGAEVVAHELGEVESMDGLPYPANPYINPDDSRGWPAFCYTPEGCKGRSACPKSYACSE